MELDDRTGARLRSLAESQRAELDPAAHARIAARTATDGPRVLRRSKQVRAAVRAGSVVGVLGVALVLYARSGVPPSPQAGVPSVHAPHVGENALTGPEAAPAPPPADARACASRELSAQPDAPSSGDALASRFQLGAAGTVVAEPGSALWLDARDACQLKLKLRDGRVGVHAADLGGGELRVQTPSGDVVVHGTRFAVQHRGDELVVDVAEGKVALQRGGRDVVPAIAAGQRLRARGEQQPVLEPLPEAARLQLLAMLEPAAHAERQTAVPPEPPAGTAVKRDAEALVREADALWRAGELDRARARYHEAGGLRGATAEAAWLALARRELAAGELQRAQQALDGYAARFGAAPHGGLAAEAAGIAFRLALQRGDDRATRRAAEQLQKRFADTPQARAAARWLEEHGSGR